MVHLQCLLSTGQTFRVVAIEVSLDERIGSLQDRFSEELAAMQSRTAPDAVLKLYAVQHQRLTYRQDPTTELEVLFLDAVAISGDDATSSALLRNAMQLVPWALVSWYFHERQFTFPDAIDVVVVREEDESSSEM
ncbi:hypothetical protein V7S43_013628 [Phytophthora oleae]|uniref:Uncharacterized protein n=1 Tax=Phytophthora oleae TaxID=2107226 RepID=A0ABD3F3M0_9STRA